MDVVSCRAHRGREGSSTRWGCREYLRGDGGCMTGGRKEAVVRREMAIHLVKGDYTSRTCDDCNVDFDIWARVTHLRTADSRPCSHALMMELSVPLPTQAAMEYSKNILPSPFNILSNTSRLEPVLKQPFDSSRIGIHAQGETSLHAQEFLSCSTPVRTPPNFFHCVQPSAIPEPSVLRELC